jgi:hypothetical protein
MQLTMRDQTNGRLRAEAMVVDWRKGVPLTARTLIAERVRLEWEAREAGAEARKRGALSPLVTTETMRRLDSHRRPWGGDAVRAKAAPPMTLEEVTTVALEGFRRNAFFLIVDGRQVTELDEVIPFSTTSEVRFLRLVPLIGG